MSERNSLLNKLKNDKVDLVKVLNICVKILDDNYLEFNHSFLVSEYSIMETDFYEAYHSIMDNYNAFEVTGFLYFCDLVLSVLYNYKGSYSRREAIQVIKILENALNTLGYGLEKEENNCVKCYQKDLIAEIVASEQPQTIKEKIYKYLGIHYGDINQKRGLLKTIIDDVEVFCNQQSRNNSHISKTQQFFQCVRHTKDDPKKEFQFYYDDEEKWLDYIFHMIIDILAYKDLVDRTKEIVKKEKMETESK